MPENTAITWVGSLVGIVLGWLGLSTRGNSKDIKEFPEKYVMKEDYRDSQNVVLIEIRGIREDIKTGLERVHDRIDNIKKQ